MKFVLISSNISDTGLVGPESKIPLRKHLIEVEPKLKSTIKDM